MSRAGAPSKRKDVLIKAPAGIFGRPGLSEIKPVGALTPKEVISMQALEIAELKRELEVQKISAATLARFGICMIRMFEEHTGSDVVRIPKELYERMQNAEIQLAQPDDAGGDVFGRYIEKGNSSVFIPTGVGT